MTACVSIYDCACTVVSVRRSQGRCSAGGLAPGVSANSGFWGFCVMLLEIHRLQTTVSFRNFAAPPGRRTICPNGTFPGAGATRARNSHLARLCAASRLACQRSAHLGAPRSRTEKCRRLQGTDQGRPKATPQGPRLVLLIRTAPCFSCLRSACLPRIRIEPKVSVK